jgi:uncharacterized repeat protein (TIGR03943 family)
MTSPRLAFSVPPFVLASWGTIFLLLAAAGRLKTLLNPLFWPVEIACGILLLILAAAFLLCFQPTQPKANPTLSRRRLLQIAVLIIPFVVAATFAPPSFSAAALERRAGLSGAKIFAGSGSPSATGAVQLVDLAAAAYYPEHIPEVTGKQVNYIGQYFPGSDGEFRFCRVLMSCCAQDATPIYLHVIGPAPKFDEMQWIAIQGETFFRKDDGEWTPCVRLGQVTASQAPPDPYLYPIRSRTP